MPGEEDDVAVSTEDSTVGTESLAEQMMLNLFNEIYDDEWEEMMELSPNKDQLLKHQMSEYTSRNTKMWTWTNQRFFRTIMKRCIQMML